MHRPTTCAICVGDMGWLVSEEIPAEVNQSSGQDVGIWAHFHVIAGTPDTAWAEENLRRIPLSQQSPRVAHFVDNTAHKNINRSI